MEARTHLPNFRGHQTGESAAQSGIGEKRSPSGELGLRSPMMMMSVTHHGQPWPGITPKRLLHEGGHHALSSGGAAMERMEACSPEVLFLFDVIHADGVRVVMC